MIRRSQADRDAAHAALIARIEGIRTRCDRVVAELTPMVAKAREQRLFVEAIPHRLRQINSGRIA